MQSHGVCVRVHFDMAKCVRIRRFLATFLLGMSALAVAAQAANPTAALTEASKMLEKGIPVKAIEIINQTLTSGQIPAELAAKALMLRAQAQEKLGKSAYALADYNSAIWMQGLTSKDKSDAEKGRDRILGKLGVSTGAEKPAAAEPRAAESGEAAAKPSKPSWNTGVQTSGSEERTGGSTFNSLFGSSEASPKQPEARAQPKPKPEATAKAEPAKPRPAAIASPPRVAAAAEQTASSSTSGDATGKFAIQFSALHSEDSAISEVNRIEKRFGADLAGRTPSVKILETSDGGTLYKVIAAPYERGEGLAICELLKTKGVGCMIISR